MRNGKVQVGVVGLRLGAWHAESFAEVPGAALSALCDVDRDRLASAASRFKVERTYEDYRALCEDERVDAVSVCVPNYLHAPICVHALEHGKHVLCEKPLAHTVKAGERILEAARASGTQAMVAMKLRYSKEARHIRGLVDAGRLGEIYYGSSTYLRGIDGIPGLGGWFTTKAQSGGGALIDNGVHLLDLTWYLMGCPKPTCVLGATTDGMAPIGAANRRRVAELTEGTFDVDDFGTGLVRCENGATMFLENGWSTFVQEETMNVRLLGTTGGATLWPFGVVGEQDGKCAASVPDLGQAPEESQFEHFIRCIVADREPDSSIEQGLTVLRMLDALYRSDREGGAAEV